MLTKGRAAEFILELSQKLSYVCDDVSETKTGNMFFDPVKYSFSKHGIPVVDVFMYGGSVTADYPGEKQKIYTGEIDDNMLAQIVADTIEIAKEIDERQKNERQEEIENKEIIQAVNKMVDEAESEITADYIEILKNVIHDTVSNEIEEQVRKDLNQAIKERLINLIQRTNIF